MPVVECPPEAPTRIGIKQQLGLSDASAFRVILVHGIGDHAPNYADGWVARFLAPRLDLVQVEDQKVIPILMPGLPSYAVPTLTIYHYVAHQIANQREVDFRFAAITWSPLTFNYKERLQAEEDKIPHAFVNDMVKRSLLDRALADAVLYVGMYRAHIREAIAAGLCQALAADASAPCNWSSVDTRDMRMVFITHSLGSRIMADALLELIHSPGSPEQALLPALNRGPSFFMFANQLPLLHLGDVGSPPPELGQSTPIGPAGIRGFGEALRLARQRHQTEGAPPVTALAFSDPNDLLSYRVPAGEDYGTTDVLTFINIRVRNAMTWLGLVEWPPSAHDGYQINDEVWDIVVNGLSNCGSRR